MARKRLGSPLSPNLLKEMGEFGEFSQIKKDFNPQGNWTQIYRIWGTHGYFDTKNHTTGYLKIDRKVIKKEVQGKKTFTLEIVQKMVNDDAFVNTIEAHIWCRLNKIATPHKWNFTSQFIDPDGRAMPEMKITEKSAINSKQALKAVEPETISSNWSLFEAIQRLEFKTNRILSFNLFENLRALKKNHKLTYRGVYPFKYKNKEVKLQWFNEIGNGVLPYEYFLDDAHRVLLATSLNKAIILDDNAEAAVEKRLENELKYYQREKRQQSQDQGGKK